MAVAAVVAPTALFRFRYQVLINNSAWQLMQLKEGSYQEQTGVISLHGDRFSVLWGGMRRYFNKPMPILGNS